jgi:hypothetical protein
MPVGASIWILKKYGHACGSARMDPPAVVALVGVENLELGDSLHGYLSDSQAMLVDPTRR